MTLLTDERIKEIQDRAEKATPGPWKWGSKDILCAPEPYCVVIKPWCDSDICKNTVHVFENDAEFIAHSREDINALLSHIKAQAEEIMRLKESNFKCDKCKILPVCSTAYMKQCLINNNAHYIPKEE